MKVILRQSIKELGAAGQVVSVNDAYARNFLLPKRLAEPATPASIEQANRLQATQRAERLAKKESLDEAERRLTHTTLRIHVSGITGQRTFASVKAENVRQAIQNQFHIRLPEIQIIPAHLKTIGSHQVVISLPNTKKIELTVILEAKKTN